MRTFFIIVISFFIGSIPNGLLISKYGVKQDIRTMGSGNIGATNVLRNLGWGPALATFALDVAKGALPVFIGLKIGGFTGQGVAALFAILGHCYTPWLNFKGGKGISTGLGTILVVNWWFGLLCLAVHFLFVLVTKIVSIASLVAAALVAIGFFLMGYPPQITIPYLIACIVMWYRHGDNIARLRRGEEKGYDSW